MRKRSNSEDVIYSGNSRLRRGVATWRVREYIVAFPLQAAQLVWISVNAPALR